MLQANIAAQILHGSLCDYPDRMSGDYRGYHVTIQKNNEDLFIKIDVNSSADDPENDPIKPFLNQYTKVSEGVHKVYYNNYVIGLLIRVPKAKRRIPQLINQTVEPLIAFLASQGYQTCCEKCARNDESVVSYEIYGVAGYYCEDCLPEAKAEYEQYAVSNRRMPPKFALGLIGTIIGTIIGAGCWVLFHHEGMHAGIAGIIVAVCALYGYKLFGGYVDKKGMIVSVILMLVGIYFANKFGRVWEAYDVYSERGASFWLCYQQLGDILEQTNTARAYYRELATGYVLNIAYCIILSIQIFKPKKKIVPIIR